MDSLIAVYEQKETQNILRMPGYVLKSYDSSWKKLRIIFVL